MESTSPAASWLRLPGEIRSMILRAVIDGNSSVADFATVSREWQEVMEKHNFSQIKLTPSRLVDFSSVVYRNRAIVRYIWLCVELEHYSSLEAYTGETRLLSWNDLNLVAATIRDLFSALRAWEPSGELLLDISIHSPSDSKYLLKYLTFEPDMSFGTSSSPGDTSQATSAGRDWNTWSAVGKAKNPIHKTFNLIRLHEPSSYVDDAPSDTEDSSLDLDDFLSDTDDSFSDAGNQPPHISDDSTATMENSSSWDHSSADTNDASSNDMHDSLSHINDSLSEIDGSSSDDMDEPLSDFNDSLSEMDDSSSNDMDVSLFNINNSVFYIDDSSSDEDIYEEGNSAESDDSSSDEDINEEGNSSESDDSSYYESVYEEDTSESPWWQQVPSVPAITGLLLRQQTRRRWLPSTLQAMFARLPRLQEVFYEPWRPVDHSGRVAADNGYGSIIQQLTSQGIRKLTMFENFNSYYARVIPEYRGVRAPNTAVSRKAAEASIELEHFSASFLVDARSFFSSCESPWKWPRLRSLTLTSRVLTSKARQADIDSLLISAATAAMEMPKLETLEIWNGQAGTAALFRYQPRYAAVNWKCTWDSSLQPLVIQAWKQVALKYGSRGLVLREERLDNHADITSHGDAIHYLKLSTQVVRPISLQQIRAEHKVHGVWEEMRKEKERQEELESDY